MIVVALFVFYIILSSWGVSQLQESFQLESVIPPESYYTKHNQVRFVTKCNVVRIVYMLPGYLTVTLKALRHGSHTFTYNYTNACFTS